MSEQQSAPIWPPPGLPHDARVFPLKHNDKRPPDRFMGAHHRARPIEEALLTPGPAASYGVTLEGQYLLADQDAGEQPIELPPTWTQRTRRGLHRLYRLPLAFTGKNAKWYVEGVHVGELKCHGYFVGPGSTVDSFVYTLLDDRDPAPAPQNLLDALLRPANGQSTGETRSSIPDGERDDWLTSVAGSLWNRGLDEQALSSALFGIVNSGIIEQPLGREVTATDCSRIARSAVHNFERRQDVGRILGTGWVNGSELTLVRPPLRWWVRGFVPRGELVMLYGKGGCGKSTWVAWLASRVTQKRCNFGFIGVEEPAHRFALKMAMMGGDREHFYSLGGASKLILPRDSDRLLEDVLSMKLDFLYIDSIYSHFASGDNSNAAERARRTLGALAEITQETDCSIMGTFHENKLGLYLGSVEMENVGRYLLHAKRKPGTDQLIIAVDKENFYDPGEALCFKGGEEAMFDPLTGEMQLEELEDGSRTPLMTRVLLQLDNVPNEGESIRPTEKQLEKEREIAEKAAAASEEAACT